MNVELMEQRYVQITTTPSDIGGKHLAFLRQLASECDTASELGFGFGFSAAALIMGAKGKVTSCDHLKWGDIDELRWHVHWLREAAGDRFEFIECDSHEDRAVPGYCDLLFIDTYHNYGHLKMELAVHGYKAKKYIVLHDTETFGTKGDNPTGGLLRAMNEYIFNYPELYVKYHYADQHGLTVLERRC
jgi:hypothetical protein